MPEGPEVKIVVDYLNKKLEHKEITSFSYCSDPYKIKYKPIVDSLNKLTPFRFTNFFCQFKATY